MRVICFFFSEEAWVNLVPAVNFYWIVCFNVKGQNPVSFTLLKFPTKCSEGFPLIKKGNLSQNTLLGAGSVIVLLDIEYISSYQGKPLQNWESQKNNCLKGWQKTIKKHI